MQEHISALKLLLFNLVGFEQKNFPLGLTIPLIFLCIFLNGGVWLSSLQQYQFCQPGRYWIKFSTFPPSRQLPLYPDVYKLGIIHYLLVRVNGLHQLSRMTSIISLLKRMGLRVCSPQGGLEMELNLIPDPAHVCLWDTHRGQPFGRSSATELSLACGGLQGSENSFTLACSLVLKSLWCKAVTRLQNAKCHIEKEKTSEST